MREKDRIVSVNDAVYKLQLALLHGISSEKLLLSAVSLMSRSDYEDVVIERSIANICGYPLCSRSLPSERPRESIRSRISNLRNHDSLKTSMYCSFACFEVNRTFAEDLKEERCWVASEDAINDILNLFGDLDLNFDDDTGKNLNLGFSELKLHEKTEEEVGELFMPNWIGPSNAIEGYIPQADRTVKSLDSSSRNNELKSMSIHVSNFMGTMITEDEYSISKTPSSLMSNNQHLKDSKEFAQEKGCDETFMIMETAFPPLQNDFASKREDSKSVRTRVVGKEEMSIPRAALSPLESMERKVETQGLCQSIKNMQKSCLKSTDAKKSARSVTWADKKIDGVGNAHQLEALEINVVAEEKTQGTLIKTDTSNDKNLPRFASVEACTMVLSQIEMDDNTKETNVFDLEDSWYDTPPEGFSLTLSPFAIMWNTLFSWITSSSIGYIYGCDESAHEEFLLVNGREYYIKVVLSDGRSDEIKQTVSGCLARALPGLVTHLRLPTPLSSLEQRLGHLLDTMSFVDAVPSLRMQQWQLFGVLFIEAISVCKLPALFSHLASRRLLIQKVVEDSHIRMEEYEVMREIMIPLPLEHKIV